MASLTQTSSLVLPLRRCNMHLQFASVQKSSRLYVYGVNTTLTLAKELELLLFVLCWRLSQIHTNHIEPLQLKVADRVH